MQPVLVQDLHNREVVTASGTKLGLLKDVSIDIDSGRVVQFYVKHGLIGIGGTDLLIAADAVIEIREDVIVVKDLAVGEPIPATMSV
ncbi:MAG: PRC-barrel domain-containing protein [Candidatus Magasanikbacteria bacterium]|nr:PRC-barrel domain-containing protein [Candidatus Magasanikbacteria bacterium]